MEFSVAGDRGLRILLSITAAYAQSKKTAKPSTTWLSRSCSTACTTSSLTTAITRSEVRILYRHLRNQFRNRMRTKTSRMILLVIMCLRCSVMQLHWQHVTWNTDSFVRLYNCLLVKQDILLTCQLIDNQLADKQTYLSLRSFFTLSVHYFPSSNQFWLQNCHSDNTRAVERLIFLIALIARLIILIAC